MKETQKISSAMKAVNRHSAIGKTVLLEEASALISFAENLPSSFDAAVEMISECQGKLVISGMGKSGLVGQKISATFSSTGTPSFFLHPAESLHGDLGAVSAKDLVVAISNSGESAELKSLIEYCKRRGIPLIGITSKPQSTLGLNSDILLPLSAEKEACPLGLAPTTSSTMTLALGDALAMAVLENKGFTKQDFAMFHPGGSLGRSLLTRVSDLMHRLPDGFNLSESSQMHEVIEAMTSAEVRGIATIVDKNRKLLGCITDGDLRRLLNGGDQVLSQKVSDVMTREPAVVFQDDLAQKALRTMEEKTVSALIVVDGDRTVVGTLHVQDLIKGKIK